MCVCICLLKECYDKFISSCQTNKGVYEKENRETAPSHSWNDDKKLLEAIKPDRHLFFSSFRFFFVGDSYAYTSQELNQKKITSQFLH